MLGQLKLVVGAGLLTVKVLDVPVFVPPWSVAVIVFSRADSVTVNDCVNAPDVNALDGVGNIVPAVVVRSTVPA